MPQIEGNGDSTGGSHSQIPNPTRRSRWHLFIAMLLAIYVLRGVMLACVVPPLEMWDEYQHLAYIDCVVRTGQSPIFGVSRVDPDLLRRIVQLPASPPEWAQLSRFGAVTYQQYWDRSSAHPIVPAVSETLEIYEAQHPPIYYWLVSPIYRWLGSDLPLVISVLRLLNVTFTTFGLAAILIWLKNACRDQRHAALLALCIILQPLFLLNADRVANDALAVMLGSFAIVWSMSLRPGWLRTQSLGLGLLIGLGVMTKATDLILLPFAGFCLVLLTLRHHNRTSCRASMQSCAILIAGTLIVTGHYMLWSLRTYGTITPMQEAVMNKTTHVQWADYLRYAPFTATKIRDWRIMVQHWIIGDGLWIGGWTGLHPPGLLPAVYELLIGLSAFAWIITRVSRRFRSAADPFTQPLAGTRILVLCLLMLLAMSYHSIQSMVAWRGPSATTPWYAEVIIPWLLIGLFSGPFAFRGHFANRLGRLILLSACILFLATETHGVFILMVPRYSSLPLSANAFRRLSTLHPSWLNGITLSMATAAELSLVALVLIFIFRRSARHSVTKNGSE